jgi:hypothetical protein
MTLDKARESLATHVESGGGYNRNAVRMVLGEVMHEHVRETTDQLMRGQGLEQKWQIKPRGQLASAFKKLL